MLCSNKIYVILLIAVYCITELSTKRSTTLNVQQRVAFLKQKIKNEIREKLYTSLSVEDNSSSKDNDYKNDRSFLTPIMTSKIKIKKTRTSMMTATTDQEADIMMTTTPVEDFTPFSQIHAIKEDEEAKNISDKLNVFTIRNPVDIFYRRLLDENKMNSQVQWVHCQDMITPFLQGTKKTLGHQNHLSPKSPVVKRFIHLLTLNTTLYTKEDILSVLYQISNLQLRFFQWDVHAINLLFNILMKDKKHTFRNLKWGIRTHFEDWRLDISNVTNLLQQTRLFRPPCINTAYSTGSTKSKKVSSYPKKTTRSRNCGSGEEDDCVNQS